MNVARSVLEPGSPGTKSPDRGTVQVTVALTLAGSPGRAAKPARFRLITGRHSSPSLRRAACALASAARCAWPAVSEIDA